MSIELDERNLLPPGVHDASIKEVEDLLGRFQKSDRRIVLLANLKKYLDEVRKTGWKVSVILDGSFVMGGVDEPGDIDVILVLPADWDLAQDLRPFEYNLVSNKRVQKEYEIEVMPVRSGSDHEARLTKFFQRVNIKWCRAFDWPLDATKGLVRIIP